jgi:hypothetical protein
MQDADRRYTVVIGLQKSRTSAKGKLEYRRTLKDIVYRIEQELGPYRRKR